jgi:hypothetical protein
MVDNSDLHRGMVYSFKGFAFSFFSFCEVNLNFPQTLFSWAIKMLPPTSRSLNKRGRRNEMK